MLPLSVDDGRSGTDCGDSQTFGDVREIREYAVHGKASRAARTRPRVP